MAELNVLAQIKQQKEELLQNKKHPIGVKMSERTWAMLEDNDLGMAFGDVDTQTLTVLGLRVFLDGSLPVGVTRVYVDAQSVMPFAL